MFKNREKFIVIMRVLAIVIVVALIAGIIIQGVTYSSI